MSENFVSPDVTSDDKLWAALAYILTPIIPIIILFLEDKKDRPFIRAHNMQALVWGLVYMIVSGIIGGITFGCGTAIVGLIGFAISVYWAYQAYQGKMVEIPVISNLVRNQGWA